MTATREIPRLEIIKVASAMFDSHLSVRWDEWIQEDKNGFIILPKYPGYLASMVGVGDSRSKLDLCVKYYNDLQSVEETKDFIPILYDLFAMQKRESSNWPTLRDYTKPLLMPLTAEAVRHYILSKIKDSNLYKLEFNTLQGEKTRLTSLIEGYKRERKSANLIAEQQKKLDDVTGKLYVLSDQGTAYDKLFDSYIKKQDGETRDHRDLAEESFADFIKNVTDPIEPMRTPGKMEIVIKAVKKEQQSKVNLNDKPSVAPVSTAPTPVAVASAPVKEAVEPFPALSDDKCKDKKKANSGSQFFISQPSADMSKSEATHTYNTRSRRKPGF